LAVFYLQQQPNRLMRKLNEALRKITVTLLVLVLAFLASPAFARETIWDEIGTGDWFESDNWTAGVPNPQTDVLFDNGGTAEITRQGSSAQARDCFLEFGTLSIVSGARKVIFHGNYSQDPDGTLSLGIAGVNMADYGHVKLAGQGDAMLDGTLALDSLNNFRPSAGDGFLVLRTTAGERTGEFAQVDDFLNNNPNLQRIDVYAPNGVAVVYIGATPLPTPTPPTPTPPPPTPPPPTPPPPTPPPPTPTPNPRPPIIDVIPGLLPENPDRRSLLEFLFTNLNPTVQQLTSMFEISFSGANSERFNLSNRLAEIQRGSTGFVSNLPAAPTLDGGKTSVAEAKSVVEKQPLLQPGPQNRWGVWVNGWGDFVNVNDDNFAKGYDFTTGGATVGIDYRVTDHLAIGLFGSYADTWTDLQPGEIDVNTGRFGLYASYFQDGFYVNGAIFGGFNSYETSRQGLLRLATGSTDGQEFSTFIGTGYNFHFGNFVVGPIASLQYTYANMNGFDEKGSLIPLQIHSDSEESLRTDLGLQASYTSRVGNVLVIPSVAAAWEHEFKYTALPITASAPALGGATATFFGPSEGQDSAIINAGVGVQWTPRISTYAGYQGQLGRSNYNSNGVTGSISFGF
jgi:outer membrane autotransporter protein